MYEDVTGFIDIPPSHIQLLSYLHKGFYGDIRAATFKDDELRNAYDKQDVVAKIYTSKAIFDIIMHDCIFASCKT